MATIDPDAPSVINGKVCTKCRVQKPIECFPKSSDVASGRAARCRDCKREYVNSPAQREARRRYNQSVSRKASVARYEQGGKRQQYVSSGRLWRATLSYRYGISLERWHQLLIEQSGRCATCQTAMRGDGHLSNSVAIDHDHATGAVRGLLCMHCNMALGLLRESPSALKSILSYLGAL